LSALPSALRAIPACQAGGQHPVSRVDSERVGRRLPLRTIGGLVLSSPILTIYLLQNPRFNTSQELTFSYLLFSFSSGRASDIGGRDASHLARWGKARRCAGVGVASELARLRSSSEF